MVNIGNWENLTPDLITSYYLYGVDAPPSDYGDRLRAADTPEVVLEIDAVSI